MTQRIEDERYFLSKIADGKNVQKLIKSCTDEQLKSVFECVYNLQQVNSNSQEYKKVIKFEKLFDKKNKWTLGSFKKFCIKHKSIIIIIIRLILDSLLEGEILKFCDGQDF